MSMWNAVKEWIMGGPITTHEKLMVQSNKFTAIKGILIYSQDPDWDSVSAMLSALMIEVSKIAHSAEQIKLMNDLIETYGMVNSAIKGKAELL